MSSAAKEKPKSKGRRRLRSQGQQQRAAEAASGACPCSVGGGGVCAAGVGAVERRSHASLRCSLCGGVVCRACSRVVRPSARIRLCDTCYQHRELTNPSGDWFYRQLQTKFHDVTPSSSSESSLDASLEVREFIERLTENLVGGSVDDVTVEPLSSQSEYEQLCAEFHPRMQDVLTRLAQALQFAITDLSTAKLAVGGSPSEIHVQLKRSVAEMREKALKLPMLEMDSFLEQEGGSPLRQKPQLDFGKRTYEDLLSTAIINKVVEGAQCDLMEQHLKTPACLTGESHQPLHYITCMRIGVKNWKDKSISRRPSKSISPKRRQKIPQQTVNTEADSWDSAEESDNDDDDVFSDASSDNESRPPSGKCSHRRSSDMDQFFANLKYCNRVPFPELGADVVEGSVQDDLLDETARTTLYLVHSDSHHSSLSSQSWEENWLFQKKRLKIASSQPGSKGSIGRVPMLVPKPKDEHRHLRAKVGDTDADQLSSDLSDFENYMSSRNDVSSEEGDREPTSLESVDRQEAALKLPPDLIEATNQEMQGTVVGGTTLILSAPSVNGNESHEFDQQEGEYLEDFASVGHRSFNSLHGDSNESSMPGTPTNETVSLAKTKNVPDILESTKNAITPSPTPSAEEKLMSKSDSVDDHLFKPPMPGTLAEREHLKWQQASPMLNNPYSEENINKRLDERKWNYIMPVSSANHSNAPAATPRQLSRDPEEPVRINCSGDGVRDIKKYGRDYYINQQESRLRKAMDAARENVSEMTSSRTSSSIEGICSSQPSSLMGSTDDLISEIESLPMPSVKELTKHFDAAAPELIQKRRRNRASSSYDKEVIIIENLAMPAPVHSLTGRNLSKDVKASLRGEVAEAPKPAERQLANLEFWRRQQGPTPVPAPRKK